MASVGTTPSGGRRRSLDAEINLVPFIDLLSMCICFLLMTAVWIEIGGVNVKQLLGSEAPISAANTYELDVRYLTAQSLEIRLKHAGSEQKFSVEGSTNGERLGRLRDLFKGFTSIMGLNPAGDVKLQMAQTVSSAQLRTMGGVSYGEIVSVMDALRETGIINLGLVPVKE